MSKKYYAVAIGKRTGIFESWDECKSLVDGFPGAKYKAFRTKKEAVEYIGGDNTDISDIPVCPPETVIAFVDGSYDSEKRVYSFGCVIRTPDNRQTELFGKGDKPQAAVSRNVAGELTGAMTAVKWTYSKGYKKLIIYHDYEGIAKWYTGEWKAESYVACAYLSFMETYRDKMNISFVKIEAHTGITLNELADDLAKKALL